MGSSLLYPRTRDTLLGPPSALAEIFNLVLLLVVVGTVARNLKRVFLHGLLTNQKNNIAIKKKIETPPPLPPAL